MELWTVLGVVVAVVIGVLTLNRGDTEIGPTPTVTAPSVGGSAETMGTAHEEAAPTPVADLQTGTCGRLEGETFAPIPCDAAHSAEIIPASGGCDTEALIRYAGGNPEADVLHEDVRVEEVAGACSARLTGMDLQQSLEDILRQENGVWLRECMDGPSGEVVPCGEEHTGEVVFRENPADPSDLRCQEHAAEYMGTPLQRHYRELNVVSTEESPRRCVVEARGANSLTGSLKNLGSNAVPIGPPY